MGGSMAKDPNAFINQFRRQPVEQGVVSRTATTAVPSARKVYEAFDSKDKIESLALFPMLGPAHSITYSYLFDVSWDDEIFSTIVLFFTFIQVNIRGRNLGPVVQSLRLRTCTALREFHEEEFEPVDTDAPVITSIEYVVKDLAISLAENLGPPRAPRP
jgi:hypothetical protein